MDQINKYEPGDIIVHHLNIVLTKIVYKVKPTIEFYIVINEIPFTFDYLHKDYNLLTSIFRGEL